MYLAIFIPKVIEKQFSLEKKKSFYSGISQLTLDEEPEDYESVSDHTSTTDHRSGDSLLTTTMRQNTVTTFGYVDKNNAPLQSPSQSLLTDTHHSGEIN